MRPFIYKTVQSARDAVALAASQADPHVQAPVQYLAGGTTLIDLMKIDVMRPQALIDIKRIADPSMRRIEEAPQGLHIGALVPMAEAAENAAIKNDYPVLSQSSRRCMSGSRIVPNRVPPRASMKVRQKSPAAR